jgi:RimJ/RimL family protein N-acetyltransferase
MLFSTAFETERLVARAPVENDIPAIVNHLSNPAISLTTLTIPYPYSESAARQWIDKAVQERISELAYTFVLELKLNSEVIGAIGLHMAPLHDRAEAGYWIAEEYWNQGYATEALTGLIRFGFDKLNLNKIYTTHMDLNPSSGKVMLKAGMKYEGSLRAHYKKGEKYVDVLQYAVLKTEFINQIN